MRITESNFLEILKQHERILFKVSNAYCEDPEDRKDIVQEIIIQLWKSKHSYNPEFKFSTWIYRISLNVAISHYRKAVKRKVSQIDLNDQLINISDENSDGDHLAEQLESLHKFINTLDKLNKALMLLYLESYSYKEISDVLGISETNVATKINRIKKRLISWFDQEITIKN
jgi:RNA polymerase sigma-70 factor (ECF subfamily)